MNTTSLKAYAPAARTAFIRAVRDRAGLIGLNADGTTLPIAESGDVAVIGGNAYPRQIARQRRGLEARIAREGFDAVMEAVAYTWFNRFAAIRYMELHGYLDHGLRVLSHPAGGDGRLPEILEKADRVALAGLSQADIIDMKLAGNRDDELYRLLLIAQCNALHRAMPFLFERIDDETELLLPDRLLAPGGIIPSMVEKVPEEDWQEIEVIGWLYQFYISERKDQVIGKVVAPADIPAATQLFTPNWIVKYMVQNTLGRQWLATYPASPLRGTMEFYVEPAPQTPEVQAELDSLTPASLDPEALTLMDPACGSGHILVEAYDLFKAIYLERGYRLADIPRLILQKNLFGLDIDDRAAQLAGFALTMKARADNPNLLNAPLTLNVMALQSSEGLDADEIARELLPPPVRRELVPSGDLLPETLAEPLLTLEERPAVTVEDIRELLDVFREAKTFGALITVPNSMHAKFSTLQSYVSEALAASSANQSTSFLKILQITQQSILLSSNYNFAVANPPYMGADKCTQNLKKFMKEKFSDGKEDLYAAFILRCLIFLKERGILSFLTLPSWMFLSSFDNLRRRVAKPNALESLVFLGRGAFGSDYGTCAFTVQKVCVPGWISQFKKLFSRQGEVQRNDQLRERFLESSPYLLTYDELNQIPGAPFTFWIEDVVRQHFACAPNVTKVASPRQGLSTSNSDRFVRYWYEVSRIEVSSGPADHSDKKWYRFNKGGKYRKWYGNNELVVNWKNNGEEIKRLQPKSVIRNERFYFAEAVTWSDITISENAFRLQEVGYVFSNSAHCAFSDDRNTTLCLLGLLNSSVGNLLVQAVAYGLHLDVGYFAKLPFIPIDDVEAVVVCAQSLIKIARNRWNSLEISPDFSEIHELKELGGSTIERLLAEASNKNDCILDEEVYLNNKLNSHFSALYRIPTATIGKSDLRSSQTEASATSEFIRLLFSYTIGCAMGRYSLDEPGLIYANSGNVGFDPTRYQRFPADADAIIPLSDESWFPDDATARFVEFVRTVWPAEGLADNLAFVAETLGPKQGEQPADTIRRYYSTQFYKDHLQTYKRRPIYWLFSSGKHKAFECLVYLHRYTEGTLARMRIDYVIPLQGNMSATIDQITRDLEGTTSTARRKELEKRRQKLTAKLAELRQFDAKLHHLADQRITLDLDDGVKVNYAKFGDLLAEVKAVTGGS